MQRSLPSSKKTHSEKHKQILKQLLREGSNKACADCKTSLHPRWASWNLGCFVCIRCSGIHRSMGTHISKVKSVDLDAWTDEQVESMLRWGNDKCNAYWEAKLPAGYVPDASKIENFIRTKYDMKKWVASSRVPDPATLAPAKPEPATTNLLDDDFGSFASHRPQAPAPAPAAAAAAAPPPPRATALTSASDTKLQRGSPLPELQPHQSAQSTGGSINPGRPDLKKSILSLYSSPSSSSSSIIPPKPQHHPPVAKSHEWANEWTGSSTAPASQTSLDDDLFKNVWK
ncbi:Arf-GAP domain-containing protein [[Candida] zeylanoides]